MIKAISVDDYIKEFPDTVREKLEQIRQTVKEIAPEAKEVISYGMPAFKTNKILIYYAGYKNHIGFYPTGSGIEAFKSKIGKYKWSKGTIQFPLNENLPVKLIEEIIAFRVAENQLKKK